MLIGRERECERLDSLVSRVRAGGSAVIIVEGEAGIGKTRLLDYAAAQADGLHVLRSRGFESEQDLPFAGLAGLVGPILGHLDSLPAPQREALAGALALAPAGPAERFAICSATFNLLSAAAAQQPVLAVVDDAHWLDAASAQALEFAAHRMGNEALGLVIAVRQGTSHAFDPSQFGSMTLTGLDQAAAWELLKRSGLHIARPVAYLLAAGVAGNPLALEELPATLTDAQLAGLAALPEPLPVAAALRRAFTQRLDALDPVVRRVLLLVAADATADVATLHRASQLLSLGLGELSAAQDAGIVRVGVDLVEFTHPLLRSAAYHAAPETERRAAHQALAEAADGALDPIRQAWHLAAATIGPDDVVADSLDVAAGVARTRNAFASASRAHQRAAELTTDQVLQVSRWMAAGEAALLCGDLTAAARQLVRAADLAIDPCVKADAQVMCAHARMWTAPPLRHYEELVAEAEAVLPFDRHRAGTLLALATGVCFMTARLGLALETATRAASLSGTEGIPGVMSQAWLAAALILTGNRVAGRQILTRVLVHPELAGPDQAMRLLRLLCGQSLMWCEDYETAEEMLQSCVNRGRALGQVADLPYGLTAVSEVRFRTGHWVHAYADATEAVELGADFATVSDLGYALVCAARIEAAMGAAEECRSHLDRAMSLAAQAGSEPIGTYVAAARGLIELGNGRFPEAAAHLARAAWLVAHHSLRDPAVIQWRPDFIESLAHCGRLAEAEDQLAMLEAEAAATGSQWAQVTAARCRGLLQDSRKQAVAELEEAAAMAEASASAFEHARTRLCLGEAMRRARRTSDARYQLEQAHTVFELLGARPWAGRAIAELAAMGATAAPQRAPIHLRLTPQELRVALQVAEGLSNLEVAARLFLSPRTIEVHLGHIYRKLGVRSRTGLARLVSSGAVGGADTAGERV
jgi:DNA-binding CsgD family transcriptional regulator